MPDTLPDGDTEEVAAGAGADTVQTVFETPDDAQFDMEDLELDYNAGATTNTVVEIHDSPDGTGSADLGADTRRYEVQLAAGERHTLTGFNFRRFEEDVLVLVDGNQDAAYRVTVGGELVLGPAE